MLFHNCHTCRNRKSANHRSDAKLHSLRTDNIALPLVHYQLHLGIGVASNRISRLILVCIVFSSCMRLIFFSSGPALLHCSLMVSRFHKGDVIGITHRGGPTYRYGDLGTLPRFHLHTEIDGIGFPKILTLPSAKACPKKVELSSSVVFRAIKLSQSSSTLKLKSLNP